MKQGDFQELMISHGCMGIPFWNSGLFYVI
jgi:hypothetical protein